MAHRGWAVTYSIGWAVALVPVGTLGAIVLTAEQDSGSDVWWLVGAVAGGLLGLAIAKVTRSGAALHRVLRTVGPLLVATGVVVAVAMFYQARQLVLNSTEMFIGLLEFILALLGMALALTGAGLWLAGISGRRCASGVAAC